MPVSSKNSADTVAASTGGRAWSGGRGRLSMSMPRAAGKVARGSTLVSATDDTDGISRTASMACW